MSIPGKRVALRAIEPGDLPSIQNWSNDPEIQAMLGGWHFPSSFFHMEKWFEQIHLDEINQRFAIETQEHGMIGTTALININWKDRNAFQGVMIGDKSIWGQGYGTDTVMAIMRYAFQELGFERLDTTIIEYNKASLRMYFEKCRWKEEGRRKNWYWRQGRYWDQIIVGINRDEYLLLISRTNYWNE